MKFTVVCNARGDNAIQHFAFKLGLTILDQARAILGAKITEVEQGLGYFCESITLFLTEEEARKSGHFAETTEIAIWTYGKMLNQFCTQEFIVGSSKYQAIVKWQFHPNLFFAEWERLGFPLNWPEENSDQ